MNSTNDKCSPLKRNSLVQRSLDLQVKAGRARSYLKWGAVNILLFCIMYYDVKKKCKFVNNYWYWLEYVALFFTALSSVVCFCAFFAFHLMREQVRGTMEQKSLLNDNSLVTEQAKDCKSPKHSLLNEELDDGPIINWHSSFEDSCWSFNRSTSFRRSPSLSPNRGMQLQGRTQQQQVPYHNLSNLNVSSMGNVSLNASAVSNNSAYISPYAPASRSDFMTDERSLDLFLKSVTPPEDKDVKVPNIINRMNTTATVNSFWNYCNSAAHMLKSSIYQLAPQQTSSAQHKQTSNEDGGPMQFIDTNSEVIKRISTEKLSQYVANLRMWISTTILQRLVKEFENLDSMFRQRGLSDIQIGAVGLERLRKAAENQQFVSQYIPMLPAILPFLDMCLNQEYLVQRIKDLAQGSCIADYRWNTGGDYNGQKWAEHLPTDSAILFHLFCTYLDSQLMPLPQGGGRPFYSRYVILRKDNRAIKDTIATVHNKAHCAILCTNPLAPKFNFISEKELHNCAYNRNNLFYVIIQFLIYMRAHHDSTLEGVNLGKSGINIMCVIQD